MEVLLPRCKMQRLFVISCFFVIFMFRWHQTDAIIHQGTNTSHIANMFKLSKIIMESTPENTERIQQEFLQHVAQGVTQFQGIKRKEHINFKEKRNILSVKKKLKKKSKNHDTEKRRREKLPAEFLEEDATDNKIDPHHQRKKSFSSNAKNLWQTKVQTTVSNKESTIFEDLPEMIQHYHQSDMSSGRSSRQRRTIPTRGKHLVCQEELSCRNKCQDPRRVLYETKFSCFCDEDCDFFRDCCADYDDFCGTSSGQNVTNSTKQNRNLVTLENRDLWNCYKGEKIPGTVGVWMIGSCPRSWPEDDVLYRCRNLSAANRITRDNYRYLPVYTSNGRVYHNRFCAQCNGVPLKDLGEFSLSIECEFTPPRHLSFENTISYLFSYCQKGFGLFWSPKRESPRRYCLDIGPVFECSSAYNIDINKTLTKCRTGKSRIVTSRNFYRNIDCAKCNKQMNDISCGPNISAAVYGKFASWIDILPPPKPFSVIFDFNNDNTRGHNLMKIQTFCPSNKVYDPHLDVCRQTIPALPSFSNWYEYHVILWLEPRLRLFGLNNTVYRQEIAQALGVPFQQVINIRIIYNISFTLQIRKNQRLQTNVRKTLEFQSPFNITIDGYLYTVVKANKRILSCVNRHSYVRNEYTVQVRQDGTSAVSIKKTGEVFKSTEYYINTTQSKSANDSQAIFVCRLPQISNCSGVYILINEGEFRVLMNKSIFVNASKQVYDWSEYTWINKSVLVCENFSNTYYKSKKVSPDDPVLTTITIVCMSLSITGLVFVLVTYSLFSELRPPPGINLMNLSVSILLAQLLWLLGSGQTDTAMACTVIAVILHYLFLVSFVWTSIIAFDTWRAFSAKGRRPLADSRSERMKHCLRHMAVGWLPGLVYVSICVVLDFTETVNIGYKSREACWMGNKWAILYFFAVPVSMLLLFNLLFFILAFRAIKVTTVQARAASDHNTPKYFGIYVRIASLMGFTWIFGFAAPFGWQFLWYPFVILNGLQGVYIALAFPLSKRARGLYKRLCKGHLSSNETTNTSFSKGMTSHTDLRNRSIEDSKL